MTGQGRNFLARLRPRADTLSVSQSRPVASTGCDGFITGGPDHGLFVHQTRLLSRYVWAGFHDDVDLASFTQQPTAFRLELEVDADFADQDASSGEYRPRGEIWHVWRESGDGVWELLIDYRADYTYDQQGNTGTARMQRGLILRIENAASAPSYEDGRLAFDVQLAARGTPA